MKIIESAMQMEKEAEQLYRELAHRSAEAGIATILHALADAEVKHYNILRQMMDRQEPEMGEDTIREDTRSAFQQLQTRSEPLNFEKQDMHLCLKAREIEEKARSFYMESAKEMESPAKEELFYKIADEEKVHSQIVENILALAQ